MLKRPRLFDEAARCRSVAVRAGPDELETVLSVHLDQSGLDRGRERGSFSLTER
jgi:hypothetical protein